MTTTMMEDAIRRESNRKIYWGLAIAGFVAFVLLWAMTRPTMVTTNTTGQSMSEPVDGGTVTGTENRGATTDEAAIDNTRNTTAPSAPPQNQ